MRSRLEHFVVLCGESSESEESGLLLSFLQDRDSPQTKNGVMLFSSRKDAEREGRSCFPDTPFVVIRIRDLVRLAGLAVS